MIIKNVKKLVWPSWKTVTFLGVNGMKSCDREEIIFKLFKM